VVIITTPHTEPATQAPPDIESPQKLKPEKDGLGVFAKILAGLVRKTGTGEGAAGAQVSGEVPLAETAEFGEMQAVSNEKKGVRSGKTAKEAAMAGLSAADNEKSKTKKALKTGEIEPEQLDFQEKNILFAVDRLINQNAEQSSPAEDGEVALKTDSGHNVRELVKAEADVTRTAQETIPREVEKQPEIAVSAAFAAAETAENPKNTGEKAKTHVNTAEIRVSDRQAAREPANDTALRQAEVKNAATGETGRNRLEEARSRSRQKVTFEVRDFRSAGTQAEAAGKDGVLNLRAAAETRLSAEGTGREVSLELRLPNQGQEGPSALTTWEAKAGQAFEDILARELHQNFNNDIVRHASVMLRDGNEGTIRLALKPESLGNVQIRLDMSENKITGLIVVESEEALRAFEREISSLEKAFRDSGFEGANLEMSLAADSREAQQQWRGTEASRALPWQFAASRYDTAIEGMEMPLFPDAYWQGARAINMLA
jgi:flagellar hook-length control protein FliK